MVLEFLYTHKKSDFYLKLVCIFHDYICVSIRTVCAFVFLLVDLYL